MGLAPSGQKKTEISLLTSKKFQLVECEREIYFSISLYQSEHCKFTSSLAAN